MYFFRSKNNVSEIDFTDNKYVNMARICVFISKKVNGVSKLHSDILKNNVFDVFYKNDNDKKYG